MYIFKPLDNQDARRWMEDYLGDSLIKTISRTKFTAKVLVRSEGGVEKEVIISLPATDITIGSKLS